MGERPYNLSTIVVHTFIIGRALVCRYQRVRTCSQFLSSATSSDCHRATMKLCAITVSPVELQDFNVVCEALT